MITFTPSGRLANNLFQIAAAYSLSRRVGTKLLLPDFTKARSPLPDMKAGFPALYDDPHITEEGEGIPFSLYREPQYGYRPLPEKDGLRLLGFFQSEKYFEDCASDIRRMLNPNPGPMDDRCAIHVRRGDYVGNPAYNELGLDWYRQAMNHCICSEFTVFSDDPLYCRHFFEQVPYRTTISEEMDPVKAMLEMSRHSWIIMANSSFSWWGAWLSGHNRVVAPLIWFNPNHRHMDDRYLIPERWRRI